MDLSALTLRWYAWLGRRALTEPIPACRDNNWMGRFKSSNVTISRVPFEPT